MSDLTSELDAMIEAGTGRLAPAAVVALYREAFDRFGTMALWNRRASAAPTIAQALLLGEALRQEGNLQARRLAVAIETACRAAL